MNPLTNDEKKSLLHIARSAIKSHLKGKPLQFDVPLTETLETPCGAFVTIKVRGELRGCIGLIIAEHPLYSTVAQMAVSAATSDYRFDPMTVKEMEKADLEISVLTPFETISDISKIEVGKHGLYIMKGPYHGLLLPQVAVENNWDVNQFLQYTCLKAGLPTYAWKDKNTTIQIFSAEVFGEKDFENINKL